MALLEAAEGKMSYKLTLRREKKTRLMNRDCVRRKCNEGYQQEMLPGRNLVEMSALKRKNWELKV